MKTKQTFSKICLLFAALFAAFSAPAQFIFTTNNGALTITGYTGAGGTVTIPSATNGLPIIGIGASAFASSSVGSVIIPGSVTNIGAAAFEDCYSLTGVTISNGVVTIGNYAFSASALTNVMIPNSVVSLGGDLFDGCASLTNIAVGVANISYSSLGGVLFDKSQATVIQYPEGRSGSYTIPNSVTNIASSAFYLCAGLTGVTIPSSVTSIGDDAFESSGLTGVVIPDSVTGTGQNVFAFCYSLTTATVGNGLTGIAGSMFFYCYSLTSIALPSGLTEIDYQAFSNCYDLTSVTIPSGLITLGDQAFFSCRSLRSITIPDSVTNIGQRAFTGSTTLTNAVIGTGVTSIGDEAFYVCVSLIKITVNPANPNYASVSGILYNKNQTALIQYPAGLAGIYAYTISNTVTSIDDGAFSFSSLTNFDFQGNAPALGSDVFDAVGASATVYYYAGTTGWGATYGGLPTVKLGNAPSPLTNIGVHGEEFGFTFNGTNTQVFVVEASTNLVSWQPIQTNTLSGTMFNFTDLQWKNFPRRFYRTQ